MTKKKISTMITVILLAILMMTPITYADNIGIGDWIKLSPTDYGGANGGGEFEVYKLESEPPVSGPPIGGSYEDQKFATFCMEKNEPIVFDTPYLVAGINKYADAGGAGGAVSNGNGGTQDDLNPQTAFLYYHYRIGDLDTLASYNDDHFSYTDDNWINALQRAIWYFEDEIDEPPSNYNYSWTLINLAEERGWKDTTGNVYVMNLTDANGIKKQDQLVLVPEPTSMLLLGLGLLGIAGVRRKFGH